MKKNLGSVFRDGNLTFLGALILAALGFGVAYLSLEFAPLLLLKVLGLSVGLALAAIGGFSGRAKALEIKPFTSDPLGWRKAKQTYKAHEADETEEK